MRTRCILLGGALLAGVLAGPTPAHADDVGYTVSPVVTTAAGGVSLRSVTPCPPPPAPATAATVRADLYRWTGESVAFGIVAPNKDKSWLLRMGMSSVPNGRYWIGVVCETGLAGTDEATHDPYFEYGLTEIGIASAAGTPDPVPRLAGGDRIATAVAISKDLFSKSPVSAAVLASAASYADSLAGTPFASGSSAPLLLTGRDTLDPRTAAELQRVAQGVEDRVVVLLGGTSAISDTVQQQVLDLGFDVLRIAGGDRYETAAAIAGAMATDNAVDRIFVVDGDDFHDGLVAGAATGSTLWSTDAVTPVVLTHGGQMSASTASFIASHASAPRFAIGAAAAQADPGATAVGGADPVATSIAVAERFYPAARVVGIANRSSFADALAGGAHAAMSGGPLLYVDAGLPAAVGTYLHDNRLTIFTGVVYGGTAAVSEATRQAVLTRISSG